MQNITCFFWFYPDEIIRLLIVPGKKALIVV
jgi:hypothetical protein